MGVDLKGIAKPRTLKLEDLRGKRLAFDAYNALYQFLSIIRSENGELLRDRKGRVTSHLSGLFYRTANLLLFDITPIYVFNGQPPELKREEVERRMELRREAELKYVKALERKDYAGARKFAQAASYLTSEMVEGAKKLLELLGVPWIQAPSEGEATAAYLSKRGIVDGVASQDFDSLLFGGKALYRNITLSGRRKLPGRNVYIEIFPEEILLEPLLQELGLRLEQLIDVGILIGTDFNPGGFRGYGPVKALKAIKTYGRLENISSIGNELTKIDLKGIREFFLQPPVAEVDTIKMGAIEKEAVIKFLCDERDFSLTRVSNVLNKLIEVRSRRKVSLERWF